MLASFVVHVKPEENAFLGLNTGPSIHALLLRLIDESNPHLAADLHSDSQVKPFTVSPLQGKLARTGGRQVALKDNVYRLRFTTLSEDVFTSLNKTLLSKFISENVINLEGNKFTIISVGMEPSEEDPWAGLSSFEELYDGASEELKVTLAFRYPTTFRQRGMNFLFPLPANAFYGYWQKWNAFSPMRIDDSFIPWIEASVMVEAHRLQTRAVHFDNFQLNGFIGTCRYCTMAGPRERVKELNALADFAFYAGTGAKTTMGMGQTRRIDARPLPNRAGGNAQERR